MSTEVTEQFGEKAPTIRRGRVSSLSLYEITDAELDTLEYGSPSSLYLNFAIFAVSTAVSFLISLWTTDIKDTRLYTVFVVVTIVGFFAAAVLGSLWFKNRSKATKIFKRIRDRIPTELTPAREASEQSG